MRKVCVLGVVLLISAVEDVALADDCHVVWEAGSCPCRDPDIPATDFTSHFDLFVRNDGDVHRDQYCTEERILEYGYGRFQQYTGVDLNSLATGAGQAGNPLSPYFTPRYHFEIIPADQCATLTDAANNRLVSAAGITCFDQSIVCQDIGQLADLSSSGGQREAGVVLHELANGWANAYRDYLGNDAPLAAWYGSEGQAGFLAQHALTDAGLFDEAAAAYAGAYRCFEHYRDHPADYTSYDDGHGSKCSLSHVTHVLLHSLWRVHGWGFVRHIDQLMQGGQLAGSDRSDKLVGELCSATSTDVATWLASHLHDGDFAVLPGTAAACAALDPETAPLITALNPAADSGTLSIADVPCSLPSSGPSSGAFYSCPDGVDECGAPITGMRDQIVCGFDSTQYQCTPAGWQWRPDLGGCAMDCELDSTSYSCPDMEPANACGEPQSGRPQQLACDAQNDVEQCVHGSADGPTAGHWEVRQTGGCSEALRQICIETSTTFYSCPGGADACHLPITGMPDEIACGGDNTRYQCRPDGWHLRPDLGSCAQDCSLESASYTCPALGASNACGDPQTGTPQMLACSAENNVYQCMHGPGDAAGAGHWEPRWIGDCLTLLGQSCAQPATSFYACPWGADACGAPITGVPNQRVCGGDHMNYRCQADGWHGLPELGPCTQACNGNQLFTCDESPGLCWEPQTGVQQELNCTPFNDVMQCVRGPGDPDGRGHWSVQWLGNCDSYLGRTCSGS